MIPILPAALILVAFTLFALLIGYGLGRVHLSAAHLRLNPLTIIRRLPHG